MTRTTNARIAGFTYLFYIAVGFPGMVLFNRATRADGTGATLARIAEHATDVRIAVVLSLLTCFAALVLAVTLYAITRDEDRDVALLGLACRVGEGVLGAIFILAALGLLWLGTAGAAESGAAEALGGLLLQVQGWNTIISATFFAVGSALFSSLLLRGRMVPVPLAWLGIVASVLLVVGLPVQLAGFSGGPLFGLLWAPMLLFELVLGPWLLFRGVPDPGTVPVDAPRVEASRGRRSRGYYPAA